jgi:hypothetical protein
MHSPGPVIDGDGSKMASFASRNWHGEGVVSDSGGEVRSPSKISGRSRGNGMVSAVASELAATRKVKLTDTFQPALAARRPYPGQQSIMVQFFSLAPISWPAGIEHELNSLSSRYGSLVPDHHQTCRTSEKFHFQNGHRMKRATSEFGHFADLG